MSAGNKIARWRRDPVNMVRSEFHVEPDNWQADFLMAFADPARRRIGAKACKGPGKTAVEAWCMLNFLACYGDRLDHPKGVATSITGDNLKDNLWPELAKWQSQSEFFKAAFVWHKERFFAKDHPETWFLSARTWPKSGDPSQQANTLAGLHSKYLLFVLDESGGIPQAVMAAAEGGLTGDPATTFQKIIQAGNPTHNEGPLHAACTSQRHMWYIVTITGDPDSPDRSARISIEWARQQIEAYGRDNPWVLVNVFGEFPPASINSLLGPDEVEKAMKRHLREDQYNFSQKRLGVDVARFGDDRTVIFPRQGLASFNPVIMRGARTTDIAARVITAKIKWGSEMEILDDTGHWGHGVLDNMLTAGYTPIPIQFHGKAINPRYKNKRAEMWIEMADWVKRGGALPPIPELVGELTTPTYTFSGGALILEEKDMIKERLGRSPDLADALALTFALPDMPTSEGLPQFLKDKQAKLVSDYDPFDPARMG